MPARSTGHFLSFEGIDGSGKSTQTRLLAQALRTHGHRVLLTREPGGSPGAEEIRRLVLEGHADRWSPETELLLFTAARRDHLEKTIRPALAQGDVVICDRFADSTRIYQGLTRHDLADTVNRLHDLMIGVEPDLTFLIDIDPAAGLARATARAGAELRFEGMGLTLQTRARAGFLALATAAPARFRTLNGDRSPEIIAAEILTATLAYLA
jgi:dTMP kinase